MEPHVHAVTQVVGAMSALALGVVGSAHCIVMCGGLAGAVAHAGSGTRGDGLRRGLLCATGRIAGYAIAGAVVGGAGAGIASWWGAPADVWLRGAIGAAMVALGAAVALGGSRLAGLERAGARVFRHIAPLTRRLRPLDRSWKLWVLGLVWGFLPCGLVYTALAGAAGAGDALSGAAWMTAFGLGTAPAVVGVGAAWTRLARAVRPTAISGALISVYGAWTLASAVAMSRAS